LEIFLGLAVGLGVFFFFSLVVQLLRLPAAKEAHEEARKLLAERARMLKLPEVEREAAREAEREAILALLEYPVLGELGEEPVVVDDVADPFRGVKS